MCNLTQTDLQLIYDTVGRFARRRGFRFTGGCKQSEDGDEAHARVFEILIDRARRRWDKNRGPLDAYVAGAAPKELMKFQIQTRKREVQGGIDDVLNNW